MSGSVSLAAGGPGAGSGGPKIDFSLKFACQIHDVKIIKVFLAGETATWLRALALFPRT